MNFILSPNDKISRTFDAMMIRETGRFGSALFEMGMTPLTDESRIRALLHKLAPRDCGIPLIRLGGDGDGGYLIPDDLEGIKHCFSPGVSTVSNFENDLSDRGITCFMADYSVDAPPTSRREFVFDKKFLGTMNTASTMTFSSWKDKYLQGSGDDLILQMDIEGAEYDVFQQAPDELLDQFRIMAIEFHFLDRLFYPNDFPGIASVFEKLLQFFHVVHIHPNNIGGSVTKMGIEIPKILEFTLLNKKRVSSVKSQTNFPHPLDVDNGKRKPLVLPACWLSPV